MSINLHAELKKIMQENGIANFMPWGITGGNSWISLNQLDENDYCIQIKIPGSFQEYKRAKDSITAVFTRMDCDLVRDEDLGDTFGHKRNLYYIDRQKILARKAKEKTSTGNVYNISTINAQGSNLVLGDVVNSTLYIDQSVAEIKEMIEEKGGEDKDELLSILDEVKVVAGQLASMGKIDASPHFNERLSKHLEKHGWLYGQIIGLLGSVAIKFWLG